MRALAARTYEDARLIRSPALRTLMLSLLLAALAITTVACSASPAAKTRDARGKAPDFTLSDTDGKPVSLHELLARGPVLLAFFPKAFTAG